MSGLLATTHSIRADRLRSARRCLEFLGGDVANVWSDPEVSIALTRKDWEQADDFSGDCMILHRDGLVVAADASIYARTALFAELAAAGVWPAGPTPTHLVLAAYHAWSYRLAEHLIGDYAFVIWDAPRRQLVAARDLTGLRPLFYTTRDGGVSVASSARALAELLGRGTALNLATLGADVAGLPWALGSETVYDGVVAVPPAHVLVAEDESVRIERFWHPPVAPAPHPMDGRDAAIVLRDLIRTAVSDRIGSGSATVWMSGGWDSTSVFAAGQDALDPVDRGRLRPVSISYPVGDPGREDELIDLVAARWNADVHWLHSDDIPLLDALEQRAAETDEPPAHLYEPWNRALARGTRATGARVTLDGSGGDQLFQVSAIVVADLLRAGRWAEALRLARARGRGWRHFVQVGVMPLLPQRAFDAAEAILGRDVSRHYLERRIAPWVRAEFAAGHSLRERDLALLRATRGDSLAQSENILYLTLPFGSAVAAYMRGPLLDEGVENRSPLLDRRVVEFALSRPIHERASAYETKTLLRGSMEGLLPPSVLARRSYRTGVTVGFSRRRMREAYPGLVERLFARPLLLADLGIVEPAKLRDAAQRFFAGDRDEFLRVNLFYAMKVEFWLRGLEARSAAVADRAASTRLDFAAQRRELSGPVARISLS